MRKEEPQMAKPKVYIDGKEGTTGLQIYDRLAGRSDIELLLIEEEKRKDTPERKKLINEADIVFLCLPDEAATMRQRWLKTRPHGLSTPQLPTERQKDGLMGCRSFQRSIGGWWRRQNG